MSRPELRNEVIIVKMLTFRPTRSSESVNSKFAVSAAEYVRDKYPEYCNGWLYVLHPDMAEKIAVAASTTPFLFVDDIFVTGWYLGIFFLHAKHFY